MTELRALVCSHVFEYSRPVLLVAREDGEWLFLCGGLHTDDERFHVIGVNHLLQRDPSLEGVAGLEDLHEAQRGSVQDAWTFSPLEPEDGTA